MNLNEWPDDFPDPSKFYDFLSLELEEDAPLADALFLGFSKFQEITLGAWATNAPPTPEVYAALSLVETVLRPGERELNLAELTERARFLLLEDAKRYLQSNPYVSEFGVLTKDANGEFVIYVFINSQGNADVETSANLGSDEDIPF